MKTSKLIFVDKMILAFRGPGKRIMSSGIKLRLYHRI